MRCCMVWHGMVWCCMVWYGMVWYDVVLYGMVWCGVVWYGVVWCGVVLCGMVRYGMVWCGMMWCAMVWGVYTTVFLKMNPPVGNMQKTPKIKNKNITLQKLHYVGLYCITPGSPTTDIAPQLLYWRHILCTAILHTSYMCHSHDTSIHLKQTFYPRTQVLHTTHGIKRTLQVLFWFILSLQSLLQYLWTITKLPKYHI